MAKFIIGNIVVVQDIDEHGKPLIRKLQSITTDVIDKNATVLDEAEFHKIIERARAEIKGNPGIDGVIFQAAE